MAIAWPAGVRTSVLRQGYVPAPAAEFIESQMERGTKTRRISSGSPEIHSCALRLPFAEYILFQAWIKDVWSGQRFIFPNPTTGANHDCNFKLTDGKPFAPSATAGAGFYVKFELQVYP